MKKKEEILEELKEVDSIYQTTNDDIEDAMKELNFSSASLGPNYMERENENENIELKTAYEDSKMLDRCLEDYKAYYGIIKDVIYSRTKTSGYKQIVFVYEVNDGIGTLDVFDSCVFTGTNNKYSIQKIKKIIRQFGFADDDLCLTSFKNLEESLKILIDTKVKIIQEPNGFDDYKKYLITALQKYDSNTHTFIDKEVI